MADETAISALSHRYAAAVDAGQFDALTDVFTADGVLESPNGRREGIEAILAAMEGLRRYESTDHRVGPIAVQLTADEATGEVACEAHHVSLDDDGRRDRVMVIRYADRYVRTDRGWRIARRRLQLDDEYTVELG